MALETLKDINEVDGFPVARVRDGMIRPKEHHIVLDEENSLVLFRLQDGPIGEAGENGCQVDQMLSVTEIILKGLNEKFPCRENSLAITKIQEAKMWLEKRKKDRVARGVEGKSCE